jgi:hypothetical protein
MTLALLENLAYRQEYIITSDITNDGIPLFASFKN